ncbi:MAG: hypothetical protein ABIX37_11245 [Gammaproteobacteria bacterium]
MLRLVRVNVKPGTRFKRFWVPSLDNICELSQARAKNPTAGTSEEVQGVTDLIGHVRIGGTNKSTASARLAQADAAVMAALLQQSLPGDAAAELRFLDVGCSAGTTSLETVERIERALARPVSAWLMDRYIWIRRAAGGGLVEYTSSDDQLVMVRRGRLALAPAPASFLLAPATNALVAAYLGRTGIRRGMQETGRFPLLSPHVMARPDLKFREGNVLVKIPEFVGRMHLVRAANLLHADYFSVPQLQVAIGHLAAYLMDGGLLVLTRNHQQIEGEVERGTVWRRNGSTLTAVADFGGGSELKHLVDDDTRIGSS